MFRPDQPIDSAKQDLLERGSFSNSLADAIIAYKHAPSIVTALYGPWGSGKSSVVNMALERIDEVSKGRSADQRPIVIRFNPWNYSDQDQLITQFFRELSVVLKRKDYGADAQKAGEQLEAYAEFFKPLALIPDPTLFSNILSIASFKVVKTVGAAAKKWGELKKKSLPDVRADLDKLLEKQRRKILIVIDDIDRLSCSETRQIFQLVKMLGDFPNTVYLLAFERRVVEKALEKVQEGPGDEYLEKIVQIPFDLPVISKQEVERLLFSQLDELIAGIAEEKWDQTYWGNVYHSGLRDFFQNIRDVTRYINSLRFSFGMVKKDVNAIDFLTIVALQVFEPTIFADLRDNKDLFAGVLTESHYGGDAAAKQAKVRCDDVLSRSNVLGSERMRLLLTRLFPKLESLYSNMGYGADWLQRWRRDSRVCSPDVFDVYFRLSIPKGELSNSEMEFIVGIAGSENAFAETLVKLTNEGKVTRFLERLEDYTEEAIQQEHIPSIVRVLMNIGDSFPEGRQGMLGTDTPMRLLRVMYQLSRQVPDQNARFELFRDAILSANDSLYTIVHEVVVQGQQHGKFRSKKEEPEPEERRTVSAAQLTELETIACQKIREWAASGRLRKHPHLVAILYSWRDWCPQDAGQIRELVLNMANSDEGLVQLIQAFAGKSYSQGYGDHVGRINLRVSLESISNFVPLETITPRVRAMIRSEAYQSLPEDGKQALKTYIDTVDGKVKER